MATRVAFLGLGAIGAPMAVHIARQQMLSRVWNRTAERAESFAQENGVRAARTPSDAVADVDLVITCLPSSSEVEEVLWREDGIAAGLAPGAVLVDCTSGDPALSRRIAERLSQQNVGFVDAPVSGGVSGAQAGTLTVMCGGDSANVHRVRPVLATFGSKIVHTGPVGTAHALKAVNNALLALHIWSTAEGLAALSKLGVDPALALEVINASSGRSNASMSLFPERVLDRSFPNTFRLALLAKDAAIAVNVAHEARTAADTLELGARLFAEARAELGERADHVEAVKVVERRSGVTLG